MAGRRWPHGALLGLVALALSYGQQEVRAPGSQVPAAPLPRYIYNVVSADFAVAEGYPLVKTKFSVYDPVGPTTEQFDSNITKMGELNIDTFRLEVAWGRQRTGFNTHRGVGGAADKLVFDFQPLDHIIEKLRTQNVLLLASFGYTPAPLQDAALAPTYGGGKRRDTTPPKDIAKFKETVGAFIRHSREAGLPIGVDEIWNEPDGTYGFFSGTEAEYQQLYKASVEAIRAEDPTAVVAGPASDHHMLWSRSFIDFVAQNKLPLDFYTFHEYGSGELAARQVARAAASLNRYPALATTALSLDEWHDGECCEWCADDARNHFEAAPELLHDFDLLLKKPELASVSWAWWEDPKGRGAGCMGLVTAEGKRKAVFNAWKLYATMPVDRRAVTTEGPLESMASADDHRAGLLIWNRGSYERRLDTHLNNLPFTKGSVKIYRIDAKHASAVDGAPENLAPEETYPIDGSTWSWVDGRIPRNGVLYLEASDDTPAPVSTSVETAKVIRINRYYPARGKTASYADFDRKTWIARLGMEDSIEADQEIGVLAEGLPDSLDIGVSADGKLRKVNSNSLLGVRVDYSVDGKFTNSALFHGPLKGMDVYDRSRKAAMPFGTERPADATFAVPDFGHFRLPMREHAPAHWDRTAHLTFIMQNAGTGAMAKFTVRAAAGAAEAVSGR
jgi:xylan 1,4-beta-xylosidase